MRHLYAICLCSAGLLTCGAEDAEAQFYGVGYARRSCCYGSYYAPVTSYYSPVSYTSYYVPLTAYYGASACCPTYGCNTCGTSNCCTTTVGYAPAQNCCGTSNCCASVGCCCPTGCSTGCCGAGGCSTGNCVTGGNIDRASRVASAPMRLRPRTVRAPVPQPRVTKSVETQFVSAGSAETGVAGDQRWRTARVAQKPTATSTGWEPIR